MYTDAKYLLGRVEEARKRGAQARVFDWDKAAQIIKERQPAAADAGLLEDWFWTADTIYGDGKPLTDAEPYLGSIWATPVLRLEDGDIECWIYQDQAQAVSWDQHTVWPESALKILEGGAWTC